MHTTLSSKWRLPALFMAVILLAGCGVTTKKTFLDEPVQKTAGNAVPVSSDEHGQSSRDGLSRNPALDSADATGVQKLLNIITPYRINIQQGNFISQEMLERIQPGMTKEQVRFALGTPLLTDIFHATRWDYIFRMQKPTGQITNNRVIIYFEDNRVARVVNDPLPAETQYLESIAGPAPKKKETDKAGKDAGKQPETPAPGEASSVAAPDDAAPEKTGQEPLSSETVEAATLPVETLETTPVSREPLHFGTAAAGTQENVTSAGETETPSPAGTYRSEPVAADTPDTAPSGMTAAETPLPEKETDQPAPVQSRYDEKEPVPAEKTQTEPVASTPGPVRTDAAQPAREETPARAATTVRDVSAEPEDNFRAAPNSTMQLHELMQQP